MACLALLPHILGKVVLINLPTNRGFEGLVPGLTGGHGELWHRHGDFLWLQAGTHSSTGLQGSHPTCTEHERHPFTQTPRDPDNVPTLHTYSKVIVIVKEVKGGKWKE